MRISVLRLSAILLFLAAVDLRAQVQLLSGPDRRNYRLPAANQIQSAGSIGSSTLVAWGTSRQLDSFTTADHLVMQIVRDGAAVGTPVAVGSESSRPYGTIAVVPCGTSFVVIWNDRRQGAEGVYARGFDTAGVARGDEQQLSSGMMAGPPAARGLSGARGVVVWNDSTTVAQGVWLAYVSERGTIDSVHRVPGTARMTGLLQYDFLPGAMIVPSDRGGWFIGSDGRRDSRPIIPQLGKLPSFLREDSSVVTVTRSRIEFRRSMFDSTVVRDVVVPGLDSAVAGTVMIARDSAAGYLLRFVYMRTHDNDYGVDRRVREIRVDSSGLAGDMRQIAAFDFVAPGSGGPPESLRFRGGTRQRGCNNSVLLHLLYDASQGDQWYSADRLIGVDEAGSFVADARSDMLCRAITGGETTLRIGSDTNSRVRLDAGAKPMLEVPIAPVRIRVMEKDPMLTLSSGKVVAGWVAHSDSIRLGAAVWSISEATTSPLPDMTLLPGRPADPRGPPKVLSTSRYEHIDDVLPFDGGGGYSRSYSRMDGIEFGSNSIHEEPFGASGLLHFRTTSAGWRGTEPIRTYANYGSPWTWLATGAGDPVTGLMFIAARYTWNHGESEEVLRVMALDSVAARRWQVDIPLDSVRGAGLVPIGPEEFMLVRGTRFQVWGLGGKRNEGSIALDSGSRFIPLLDRTFLAIAAVGGRLKIRRFDSTGREQRAQSLDLATDPARIFVLQKRVDSSIALIWPRDDGIHGAFLSPRALDIATVDTLLVAREGVSAAAAIFLGDTLAIAWAESVRQVSGVYGSSLFIHRMPADTMHDTRTIVDFPDTTTPPDTTIVPDPPDDSTRIEEHHQLGEPPRGIRIISEGIYPNPASGSLELRFALPFRSDVLLEICSLDGAVVRTIKLGHYHAGRASVTLPLHGLAGGTYYLRVRSDFGAAATKVLVAPEP